MQLHKGSLIVGFCLAVACTLALGMTAANTVQRQRDDSASFIAVFQNTSGEERSVHSYSPSLEISGSGPIGSLSVPAGSNGGVIVPLTGDHAYRYDSDVVARIVAVSPDRQDVTTK